MINKSKFTLIDKNNAQYYREFSNISESIVSFIIEKLISYTFTELDRKDLDCKLPDHCFEFLQGFVNNCVKAEFIAHDRDDLDDHRLGVEFIPRKSMQNKDNSNLHSTNSFEENLRNYALTDKIKLHKQSTNRMNNTDTLNSDESGFILNNNVNRPPFHVIENSLFYDNLFLGTNEWGVIPEPVTLT